MRKVNAARPDGFAAPPDLSWCATGDSKGELVVTDLVAKTERWVRDVGDELDGVAVSRDGRVACCVMDGTIRVYDREGTELENLHMGGGDHGTSIGFSADGGELIVGTSRSRILCFERR